MRGRPVPIVPGPGQESVWQYPRPPRVEPVAARLRAELSGWKAQKKGRPFYYEPAWDTLIKASGSTVLTVEVPCVSS